ncbi:MAG: cell division protein ZapE [Steroidobacteraceae bacterium]
MSTLAEAYTRALAARGFAPDSAQVAAVQAMDLLAAEIHRRAHRRTGWLDRLFSSGPGQPGGLYLWGPVGTGKTFLMDLLASELGAAARRRHFHRFMQEVHERLAGLRHRPDPLAEVAAALAAEAPVFCLDELAVHDIADAMLLAGLFGGLLDRGTALVVTSNLPPHRLYEGGLQRQRFMPAIELIERRLRVIEVDGGTDYRLRALEQAPLYFDCTDPASEQALEERFTAVAGRVTEKLETLRLQGRQVPVLRAADGVAWFDFQALCGGPRGQADYTELSRTHHTVLLSNVPIMAASDDDAARRFIHLVDEFYDRGVKLVLSAAAPPESLYRGERLAHDFLRTASRLTEMRSHDYLARAHQP